MISGGECTAPARNRKQRTPTHTISFFHTTARHVERGVIIRVRIARVPPGHTQHFLHTSGYRHVIMVFTAHGTSVITLLSALQRSVRNREDVPYTPPPLPSVRLCRLASRGPVRGLRHGPEEKQETRARHRNGIPPPIPGTLRPGSPFRRRIPHSRDDRRGSRHTPKDLSYIGSFFRCCGL